MSLARRYHDFKRTAPLTHRLMASLVAVYLASIVVLFVSDSLARSFFENLWLRHSDLLRGKIWTVVTYAWLHSVGGTPGDTLASLVLCSAIFGVFASLLTSPTRTRDSLIWIIVGAMLVFMLIGRTPYGAATHLLFNLLGMYFFAPMFEHRWRSRQFIAFWFLCAAGGAVFSTLGWLVAPDMAGDVVVGASAAVMGLIAAFSVHHANEYVLAPIPIKGKYVVVVLLVFDLIGGPARGTSFLAHLGGAATGYLLCTGYWRFSKLMTLFGSDVKKKKKSHLRLVRPEGDRDREDPPRYLH